MLAVLIAWVVYVFLFIRFLFYDLRVHNFITTVAIIAVSFFVLVIWSAHRMIQPSKKTRRAAAARQASAPPAPAARSSSGSASSSSGSAASSASSSSGSAASSASDSGSLIFRVAGTTFDNDDGTSRQDILRHLKFGDAPWADDPDDLLGTVEEDSFEGEPAFPVFVNGYQVGFVPKKHIAKVQRALQNSAVCYVSDVRIIGGGTADDGARLSYGCEITFEY